MESTFMLVSYIISYIITVVVICYLEASISCGSHGHMYARAKKLDGIIA